MSDATAQAIRADFLEWSGGFPPESESQIVVYLDYARRLDISWDIAWHVLREMFENEA